jgi:hypothetical protein
MRQRRFSFLDVVTSALFYATMMIGGLYLYIFLEPQTVINPFPPPTMPVRAVLATNTPTPAPATPTMLPTVVPVVVATETSVAPTAIVVAPETTPTSTTEPTTAPTAFTYTLQEGSIGYTTQFAYPDLGCGWMGIAGTVFDAEGNAAENMIVHVDGPDGFAIDAIAGTRPEFGPAGYEVTLANAPTNSDQMYVVQLLDVFGEPVSERYAVTTFNDCDRNLILVNFVDSR